MTRHYTHTALADMLRVLAGDLRRTPSRGDIIAASRSRGYPWYSTFERRFGGLRKAQAAAGLPMNRMGGSRKVWTTPAILAAIRHYAARLGATPTFRGWTAHRTADRPSVATIIDRLGSWNAAMLAAGLSVNDTHSPRRTHCRRRHPLTADNLYHVAPCPAFPKGKRFCKRCHQIRSRRYDARKRAVLQRAA